MSAPVCDNEARPNGAGNTIRPLTHLLDLGERGLAVKATHVCSVDGCDRDVKARSLCGTHHQRWLVHGSVDVLLRAPNGSYGLDAQCSVEGCELGGQLRRGLCSAHYQRQRRIGDPGPAAVMDRGDLIGAVFGRLTVVGRDNSGRDLRWLCRCECGATTAVYRTNLQQGVTASCGCLARDLLRKPDEEITYNSAHYRVKRAKGGAAARPCAHCGGPAEDWALSHDAAVTHVGDDGHGNPVRYSGDVDDYIPLCRPCHRRYDRPPI